MKRKAYIAGPLFNEHERWYLEQIEKVVSGCGLDTFLPHRDTHFASEVDVIGIFEADLRGLLGVDLLVALLDGQDIDSGTCVELGVAFNSLHPPAIVGITTDNIRRAYSNAMPYGVCMKSLGVVNGIDALRTVVVDWLLKEERKRGA